MKFIGYFLFVALLIWILATYAGNIFGITLTGDNTYISALIFAVILALVNLVIGGILRIITFPINLITFGLISFFITLFMIYITDSFYDNINIDWFFTYIVVALIPSIASAIIKKK